MPLLARILTRTPLHGPPPLDLLDHLASTAPHAELAMLHTARGTGHTVLAAEPTLTFQTDHAAHTTLSSPVNLPVADLLPLPNHPLHALQHLLAHVLLDDAPSPVPLVGFLGTISYDIGRLTESLPAIAPDDLHWPLLRWSLYDTYYVYHHDTQSWTLATMEWSAARDHPASPSPEDAFQRLDRMEATLRRAQPDDTPPPPPASTLLHSLPREDYLARIHKVKDYIAAGDIYQANLAQRWVINTDAAPHALYRRLVAATPAQYAAFFRFDHRAILSASPELLLQRHGSHLVTRPIKGTRPRDPANPQHDAALRDDLLNSPKDAAELAMIVDLLRNDLGRVCDFGTVQVTRPRDVQQLPTLWHTHATIEGRLSPHHPADWASLIAALCPGGSVTGAPKIRAMQIIDELEPARRAIYCGNLGHISPKNTATLNIAIRTLMLQQLPTPPHPFGVQASACSTPEPTPDQADPTPPQSEPRPSGSGQSTQGSPEGHNPANSLGTRSVSDGPSAGSRAPSNVPSDPIHPSPLWQAHLWAGGGIVADSDPQSEYEETLTKARALFQTLNLPLPR